MCSLKSLKSLGFKFEWNIRRNRKIIILDTLFDFIIFFICFINVLVYILVITKVKSFRTILLKFIYMLKVAVFFYIVRDEREICVALPLWVHLIDFQSLAYIRSGIIIPFLMLGSFRGTIRLAQPFLSCQMLNRSPVKVSTHCIRHSRFTTRT